MSNTNRRVFLGSGIAAAAAGELVAQENVPGSALSDRAHFLARPETKEKLVWCFGTVLGCGAAVSLNAPGLAEPMMAFKFPGGGSVSIEFTKDALDDREARRGAWLEIKSGDPEALKKKIVDAGFERIHHPATNTFYFAAPGGQVFGIVAARNPSAGEIKGN